MATSKVQTGLRLEPDALKKLTYIAKKHRRSINAEIELAIDGIIEKYETECGPIPLNEELE